MSKPRAAICIVSTAHPSHNPRVVKEADALAEAGYDVRLATVLHSEAQQRWDAELLQGRRWRLAAVALHDSRRLALRARARSAIARRLIAAAGTRPGLAERMQLGAYPELAALARSEHADLLIAHTPGAFAPAYRAARHFGARLGFDAEDLHSGELPPREHTSLRHRAVCAIEARYLPLCDQVTAASLPMAERLAQLYRIETPTPIHNVFEWDERTRIDGKRLDRRSNALSVYWFSQVVGLDRGLQDLVRAAGAVNGALELHIRGRLSQPVEQALRQLAAASGTHDRLHFHPKVPPTELLSRAAEHDVGAALELPDSESRRLSVTNKLFLYALAGLALVATDLPGQRGVMQAMPGAGALYAPGDWRALASALQSLIDSPDRLRAQRQAALAHTRDRFCWEREKLQLLNRVERTLGR
jgi:glycosyltransferase involved in cell wall biosynthesis